ncbi:MAG: A/G-specific adenine glycosylase [Methanomicrobiaceae archaeon]|nr:A/G-specific adenine glycosylase [Methanomicrobiaceae archaeon]
MQSTDDEAFFTELSLHGRTDRSLLLFRELILGHYRERGRHHLPWRKTSDPYHIFVSEVMLQQTQVIRVFEYFPRFISAFPDFASLAATPLAEVLRAWQGLGYNRRAKFLRESARTVVEEHGGILPDDPAILVTLPGIGRATAASIAAFAFDLPAVFIETNIRRVFIHFFFQDRTDVQDREILPILARSLEGVSPREWYSALMDYGTMLRESGIDPNQKSRSYRKQSPFEGSDRQLRGSILCLLLDEEEYSREEAAELLGETPERAGAVMGVLEKEGFCVAEAGRYRLVQHERRPDDLI